MLDSLATLAFAEDEIVVLNRTNRERRLLSRVSDDVGGKFPIRIEACVDLLQHQRTGEPPTCHGKFLGLQILEKDQGEKTAVMVMVQDRPITDRNPALQQASGECDLLSCKGDDLGVAPVEGRGELKSQIVAEPVLGKGVSIPIRDLSPRGRERSGLLLGLPSRFGILIQGCVRASVHLAPARDAGEQQKQGKVRETRSHWRDARGIVIWGGLR